MMNRKETTTSLAILAIALLATVLTATSPTPALALGHWNLDEDFTPNSELAEDGMDNFGTADNSIGEEEDNDEDRTTATTDDDEEEGLEDSNDSNDNKDSSHVAYEEFQGCLSNVEGEGSPTEKEVQDCMESSYGGIDSSEHSPTESTDNGDEDENGLTEDVSTDDTEDEEDEDSEE